MKKFTPQLSILLSYLILPIALFILFKRRIDDIILTILVKPAFSFVSPASKLYDFIVIGLIVLSGYLLIKRILNGATITFKWLLISLSAIVIFGTYRFLDSFFVFTPFSILNSVKLLDAFAILIIFCCAFSYLYNALKPKRVMVEDDLGFTIDEPTIISKENDLLRRGKFIEHIAFTISKTNAPKGAFPIGIVAPWGSGKTTFMETLKLEMDKDEFITIELNLWKCSSTEQIINALFKLLAEHLQHYSFTLNNKLEEYAQTLIKESSNGLLNSIFEKVFTEPSIEKQFERIKKEIVRIDKRILILIDDIDRLDKREIYEVIRLIRNTANFPNTFFVVAYDRNYILNAIEEINSYQSHVFLEKIFQLEFTLPPIDNSILQNELETRLNKVLTDKSKKCYKEFLEKPKYDSFLNDGQLDLTSAFIFNMRDVIRFINSFTTSYHFVKDEIFFPDFYNLELIRFKHPEIFASFYRRYDDFVTTMDDDFKDHFTYFLARNVPSNITYLEEFLREYKSIYKIQDNELRTIISSFHHIFYNKKNDNNFLSSRKGTNSHLTVVNPSTFDRYFQLGIEGLLSEVEFSNDRLLPKSEFIQKINSLCHNPETAKELRKRLLKIKDFDSKEDFESVLESILFIANTTNPYSGEGFWGYEGYNIGELLGRKDIVKQFYDNDGQKYKNYLEVLLLAKEIEFNSTNELVVSLLKRENYYIEAIFSKDDLSLILLTYLERIIANSTKLTPDLWWHYITAFMRKETPELQNNTTNISYPINDKATELIKEFILRKDMDGFIRRIAIHKPMPSDDSYVLSGMIDAVFGTKEEFCQILKAYDGASQYKDEFLKFVEDFNDAKDKMRYGYMFPASYFKIIPVQKGFSGD